VPATVAPEENGPAFSAAEAIAGQIGSGEPALVRIRHIAASGAGQTERGDFFVLSPFNTF